MKKWYFELIVVFFGIFFAAGNVMSHCQIPCGIYDDKMRIDMITEDIATVEKAMKEIIRIEQEKPANFNQMVRWIMNKDLHAGTIQEVVSQYFMTQRIKPEDEKYTEKLVLLHKMLISAMKCKQTTDVSNTEELRKLLKQFGDLYFTHEHK